jgi:hypothetical protein
MRINTHDIYSAQIMLKIYLNVLKLEIKCRVPMSLRRDSELEDVKTEAINKIIMM